MAETTPLLPSAAQLTEWGLNPSWSRRVTFDGADGRAVTWHLLDTGEGPRGTIVCVHGNPTWGYLWRDLLLELSPDWRVIAVDQTGMGYSERGRPRILAQRIDELVNFCRQEVNGPLLLAAHDWGGPVAIGASASLAIEALILANTAVAKPAEVKVPPLIATARSLADLSCRRTPLFVNGTARMTRKEHRNALRAPYRSADRREAVRDFVTDIPVSPNDRSFDALERVAESFAALRCPILLLWGGSDPVFHDRFLRDLRGRAPRALVQRFARAGHLVLLDEAVGTVVRDWLDSVPREPSIDDQDLTPFRSVLAGVEERVYDESAIYIGPDATLSWSALAMRSKTAAAALRNAGLSKGDRVSLLIPPSPDLLIAACAVWRCGGVPVVADTSAGLRQLRQLVRAAAPRFVIGTRTTLLASSVLRFAPGAKAALFGSLPGTLDLSTSLAGFPDEDCVLEASDIAAIVHTSGATGPAKAVRYSHGQLSAQRAATAPLFNMEPGDAFTTSFGAFLLLSPLLEMPCIRPAFAIDKPSTLGFDELAAAVSKGPVTTAWLSPASASAVIATAKGRHLAIKLVMVAGAPIADGVLKAIAAITGGDVRSPYGMTECLPITDGVRGDFEGALGGAGVGAPLPGCQIRIGILGARSFDEPPAEGWGEIFVAAPWLFDGYEEATEEDTRATVIEQGTRFHRTGDVGYLEAGRLFVLGRAAHVIHSANGPLASVALEEPLAKRIHREVAAVGVGPVGTQVVCLVLQAAGSLRLASSAVSNEIREHLPFPVAAILEGPLPTDRRHESKIDRIALAAAVSELLAGR